MRRLAADLPGHFLTPIRKFRFAGCASTQIETTGAALKEPLCTPGGPALSTAVYWGPQWRADQKESSLREAAALRGIEDFLSHAKCLSVTGVYRLPTEASAPSDEALLRLSERTSPGPERLVLIVVRELGPRLVIGLPALIEGGTEVLVEVRVLNTATPAESMADTRALWRNGGTFVVKGVKTLDHDMSAALGVTLMPNLSGK